MTEQVASNQSVRLASLDIFRGLTVAGMIFVNMVSLGGLGDLAKEGKLNSLGVLKDLYLWFDHAEWHNSWHLADFVFPFFLYIVGVAMAFSFAKYTTGNRPSRDIYLKLLRRAGLLFLVGLLVAGTVYGICAIPTKGIFNFSTLRVMGVLQRIALSYAIAAIIVLRFPPKVQWGIAGGILAIYWLLLALVAAPDAPAETFGKTAEMMAFVDSKKYNFAAYVDRLLIPAAHLYAKGKPGYDPEGLFSTLPAIVSVLLGYFNGVWLKQRRMLRSSNSSAMAMFALGAIVLGILWGKVFPINKALWTSSYVLFMAGWALLIFALCYELIDVRGLGRSLAKPLEWMGLNALFAFVGSVLMIKLTLSNNIDGCGDKATNIYQYLVKTIFGWAGLGHDTVLFAGATVLLWSFWCYLMYRMRWFIKL